MVAIATPLRPSIEPRDRKTTAVAVIAREAHACDVGETYPTPCRRTIWPGDLYVRETVFPDYLDREVTHPATRPICLACAGPDYPQVFELLGDTIPA